MSEKKNLLGSADKWTSDGIDKVFTITYHYKDGTGRWPIILRDREGWPCKVDKEDFVLIVGNFIEGFGLTQLTLWDTYREHGLDISVSKVRRK